MTKRRPIVVGIGELLWDVFPGGKTLGGAPVNFARHCNQLGAEGYPVSCIGEDENGAEIIAGLTALQMESAYVSKDHSHETGTVQIELDAKGRPTYEIRDGVAWDFLQMSETLEMLVPRVDAICFGTLAQRHAVSRATIQAFLQRMHPKALKLFDVNLRQDFYSKDILRESLQQATVLKLSDEELPVLAKFFSLAGSVEDQLFALKQRFDLNCVAYTRGAKGSLLLSEAGRADHPGYPADMVDSVGAGDAFAATLCLGLLDRHALSEINDKANRIAAFVCSQAGATPTIPKQLRESGIRVNR